MISVTTLLTYGGYIIAVVLLIKQFMSGDGKLKNEISADYKERNLQLEVRLKEMDARMAEQEKDIAFLKGSNAEKDKTILSLNQTILNRNPALEKTLEEINGFLKSLYKTTEEINNKTDKQTKMLQDSKDREKLIDKSTDQETGHVLRKEV